MSTHEVKRNEGIAMLIDKAMHREIHKKLKTQDPALAPREALAESILRTREVYKQKDLYLPQIRDGQLEKIKQNKEKYPELFNKEEKNNMKELEILYTELEKYRNFDDDDNSERFLEVVDKVLALKDPNSLYILLRYFNDEERSWVLGCLKGVIKSPDYLSKELYSKGILKYLSIMLPHAKEWATEFIYIILNEPECLEILKQNLHLAPKDQLLELLDKISEESKMHRPIVDELKALLAKNA